MNQTTWAQRPVALNPELSNLPGAYDDAALIHALFSLISFHHDLSIGTTVSSLSLMHRGEALRMINERLSKTPLQISCQTIGAVSALTVFDVGPSPLNSGTKADNSE